MTSVLDISVIIIQLKCSEFRGIAKFGESL